jgi:hypothetical protein
VTAAVLILAAKAGARLLMGKTIREKARGPAVMPGVLRDMERR